MSVLARRLALFIAGATCAIAPPCWAQDHSDSPPVRWRQHDMRRPKPQVVEPAPADEPTKPPSDAIVLFDGKNFDAWQSSGGSAPKWKLVDGTMETVPGSGQIQTKQGFGDLQLHIEWAAPNPPHGHGQDRGNSGVFLMGEYEIQVLDSYKADTYADGMAGSIYGQYPPLANASRPPGEWQAYDIAFRRPRFDNQGKLLEPARITVFHNGVLVQNNEEPFGPTSWLKWLKYANHGPRGPIALQDHAHPVRYRNIWVRELVERPAPADDPGARPKPVKLEAKTLDNYAGKYALGDKPDSTVATFTRKGDDLVVELSFRPEELELVPISETEFDMPFTDGRFRFSTGPDGKAATVHFQIGDSEINMKRIN